MLRHRAAIQRMHLLVTRVLAKILQTVKMLFKAKYDEAGPLSRMPEGDSSFVEDD